MMLSLNLNRFRRRAAAKPESILRHVDVWSGEDQALPSDDEAGRLSENPLFMRTLDTLRFADTDLNGHITHPVVAALFQNGRALLLINQTGQLSPPGMRWVTRLVSIEYRREIFWPGTAEIRTCVARLGTSSIHFDQSLLQENTSKATARAVMVLMDVATRQSTPIPAAMRQSLSEIAGEAS